jgi:uncharacterized membrane protein
MFKRLAPGPRAKLGNAGKGIVAVALLVSVVLMVWGYRTADFKPVYDVMPGMKHANNALMLIAVFLFGVGGTKGTLYPLVRHPMLWGTVIWAVAHLLVNGDEASLILFGGLGAWALAHMVVINRSAPWVPVQGRGIKGDAMNLVGTLVLYGLIAGVHIWLGYNPFTG